MAHVNQVSFITPKRVAPKATGATTFSLRKRGNGGWSEVRIRLGTKRANKPSMEQRLRHQLICAPC